MRRYLYNTFSLITYGLIGFGTAQAQKYFLLDELSERYTVKEYTLNTQALYQVNATIKLYNIFLKEVNRQSDYDGTIILFSVLPDLTGKEDWSAIRLDSIADKMVNSGNLRQLSMKVLMQRFDDLHADETKFWNDYKLIVKRDGRYLIANNCLLQFYAVRNRSEIFANPYGTINYMLSPISIKDFYSLYKRTYPRENFPLSIPVNDFGFDRRRDRREYLSKKFDIKWNTYYQFWTYTDWGQTHIKITGGPQRGAFAFERGVDRFVYHPIHLIVGGSFDFYFYYHRFELGIPDSTFQDHIFNERVMMADVYLD